MRCRFPVVPAIALTTVALLATPGYSEDVAPASSGQCPSGSLCVWDGTTYSGTFASTSTSAYKATGITTAKSVWNHSSYAAEVYSSTLGSGTPTCYAPGAMIPSTSAGAKSFRVLLGTLFC